MEKNNFKNKILGYLFMILGVSFPLYSFTNISINEYYSNSNYSKFLAETNKSVNEDNEYEKIKNEYNKKVKEVSGIVDPFATDDKELSYGETIKNKNEILGYLKIAKLELLKPIRYDASSENLSKGLAHVVGTSLPDGGKNTRAVIAGHRGLYSDLMFLNINKLEKNDEIELTLNNGKKITYIVKNQELIYPYEWEKIKPIKDKEMITLLSCDPIFPPTNEYRLLVNCEKKEEHFTSNKVNNQQYRTFNYKYLVYLINFLLFIIMIVLVTKLFKLIKKYLLLK